jgi:hypothetical protein
MYEPKEIKGIQRTANDLHPATVRSVEVRELVEGSIRATNDAVASKISRHICDGVE